MRKYKHVMCRSKSGKSVIFKIDVNDRYGDHTFNFSLVTGWRGDLAMKHLFFDTEDWNDDVARKYVGIQTLKSAKDRFEGMEFINTVKTLGSVEIHFWANKFITNKRTTRAWRAMYA